MASKKSLIFDSDRIKIDVETNFLSNHSDTKNSEYFFSYTITIRNLSDRIVQLISRHWLITDSTGEIQEVRGEGVVGKKPIIFPGNQFQYTSGVGIKSAAGTMEGSYSMTTQLEKEDKGLRVSTFEVPIPAFSIHIPHVLH